MGVPAKEVPIAGRLDINEPSQTQRGPRSGAFNTSACVPQIVIRAAKRLSPAPVGDYRQSNCTAQPSNTIATVSFYLGRPIGTGSCEAHGVYGDLFFRDRSGSGADSLERFRVQPKRDHHPAGIG